jgi:uncharacterized protein (TIGR02217 family)
MGFHNISLSPDYVYGSQFGAGFSTIVQQTASGHEYRVARQSQARHRFSLLRQLETQQQAANLKAFGLARRGSLFGFRLRDRSDWSTRDDGVSAPTATDQILGTCDSGSLHQFQLLKEYEASGPNPYPRKITLPVTGTVLVALDGTPTTSFTVSSTGVVTIAGGGLGGVVVQAGCHFDVPARFEQSYDEWAKMVVEDFDRWSIKDLDCIELLDETAWPEMWWPGGQRVWPAGNTDVAMSFIDGQLHAFQPTANINAYLPPAEHCPGGDRVLTIHNIAGSAGDVQLRSDTGATVGSPIVAGTTVRLALLVSGGTATWVIT